MGFRLPLRAMTLDDLEHQIRVFMDFELWDTFQEQIAPNSLQTDQDKQYEIFSIKHRFQQSESRPTRASKSGTP